MGDKIGRVQDLDSASKRLRTIDAHQGLSGLPTELWLVVFEYCGEVAPWRFSLLRNVAQTCRKFRRLVDVMLKDQLTLVLSDIDLTFRELLSPTTLAWLWERDHLRLHDVGRNGKTTFWYWKLLQGRDRPIVWTAFSGRADVRELALVTTGFSRSLLNLMGSLTNLEKLSISTCDYDRSIHHFVCHWPSLKHLTVSHFTIDDEDLISSFEGAQTSLCTLMIFDGKAGLLEPSTHQSRPRKLIRSLPLSGLKHLTVHTHSDPINELLLKDIKTTLIEDSLLTLEIAGRTIAQRGLQELMIVPVQKTISTLILYSSEPDTSFELDIDGPLYTSLKTLRASVSGRIPIPSNRELQQLSSVQLRTTGPMNHPILDRMVSIARTSPMALRHLDIEIAVPTENQEYVSHIFAAFRFLATIRIRFLGSLHVDPYVPERVLRIDVMEALYSLRFLKTVVFHGWNIMDADLTLSVGNDRHLSLQGQKGLVVEWGRRCSSLQKVAWLWLNGFALLLRSGRRTT